MSISLTDDIEIPMSYTNWPGVIQPLGAEHLDSFDFFLLKKEILQATRQLTKELDKKNVSGLLLSHVPASSPLLNVAIVEHSGWCAQIWPQSTMVVTHIPRQTDKSMNQLSRLKAIEKKIKEVNLELVDYTDSLLDSKVTLFNYVAENSSHPEWHLPWLNHRAYALLEHRNDIHVRVLAAFNKRGEGASIIVGFQIKDRLYVYKSITTIEGRKIKAGLGTWAFLEAVAQNWDLSKLFLGIGLHYYKKYFSEWSEPQFNILIQRESNKKQLEDGYNQGIINFGSKLEKWMPAK